VAVVAATVSDRLGFQQLEGMSTGFSGYIFGFVYVNSESSKMNFMPLENMKSKLLAVPPSPSKASKFFAHGPLSPVT
jgi:hypothetical protein